MSRIAIIGSGISGMVCGHYLADSHDVHLFEANDYIGGHTATIDVQYAGQSWAIDTGFIVFNDHTYPHFQGLMDHLGVEYQDTDMSFSVHNTANGLIYNGNNLDSLFAQRKNFLNGKFWGLLKSILRFNRLCKNLAQQADIEADLTLGQFLQQQGFSTYFAENYILPMGAAIWSANLGEIENFPLKFFVQFFNNHGLLNITNRPQWYSIKGGSKAYIPKLTAKYQHNIHLNSGVKTVYRTSNGVEIELHQGEKQVFDQVIFACHSDQALALLASPTESEQAVLGAIPYRDNDVVLHTDTDLLPNIPKAWASWNYQLSQNRNEAASVTYNMNILQCLPKDAPTFCVTLNQSDAINPEKILGSYRYAHPVYSLAMVAAQQKRDTISGINNTHFCGAYWYNGFHEDGVRSAIDVCRQLGVPDETIA